MDALDADSSRKFRGPRKGSRLLYGSRSLNAANRKIERILRPMAEELEAASRKPRLVLVEDCHEDALLFRNALESAGIPAVVTHLATGRQAVEYFTALGRNPVNLPDVVFLDLKLPDIPGIEVLKGLRAQPVLDGLVVFALTGSKDVWDQFRTNELQVDRYLVKPNTFAGFVEMMRELRGTWLEP